MSIQLTVQQLLRPTALTLLCLLFNLGGCSVGPDYKQPVLSKTIGFLRTNTPKPPDIPPTSLVPWWLTWNSPTLTQWITEGLANNPGIHAAIATLNAAQAYTDAQHSAALPALGLGYNSQRATTAPAVASPLQVPVNPFSLHTTQLNISYVPDVFGLNRRTIESLEAQAELNKQQLNAARLSLAANIAVIAIQLASLSEQIITTQQLIAEQQHLLTITEKGRATGYNTTSDVLLQQIQLTQTEALFPALLKQKEQSLDALAVLLGKTPAEIQVHTPPFSQWHPPPQIPLGLPAQIVQQRPDVAGAAAMVHIASANLGIAIANRWPQLTLSAAYGGASTVFAHMFQSSNAFWTLGGDLGTPLWDFGMLKHRQQAAKATLQSSLDLYRQTVLTALQNVADSFYALKADQEAENTAQNIVHTNQQLLQINQKEQKLGALSDSQLSNSRINQLQSQLNWIQIKTNRLADTVALFQALGGSWQKGI